MTCSLGNKNDKVGGFPRNRKKTRNELVPRVGIDLSAEAYRAKAEPTRPLRVPGF